MSSIIVEAGTFANIVGMIVLLDEVLNLFPVFLVFFSLVFIVDFGFDIEEGGATVSATLAAMALRNVSNRDRCLLRNSKPLSLWAWNGLVISRDAESRGREGSGIATHSLNIVLIVLVFFLLFLLVNVFATVLCILFFVCLVFIIVSWWSFGCAIGAAAILFIIVSGGAAGSAAAVVLIVGHVGGRRIEVVFGLGVAAVLLGVGRHS